MLNLYPLTKVLFVLRTLRTLCTLVFCAEKVTVPQDKSVLRIVRCTGPKIPLISECHRFREKVTVSHHDYFLPKHTVRSMFKALQVHFLMSDLEIGLMLK